MTRIARDHQDATRERLAHAQGHASVGEDGVRYIADTPLQRLFNSGKLSSDEDMNRRLYEAGERYYRDWYLSGMDTLAAMDMTRQGSGDGVAGGMPASEMQAIRRQSFREASEKLGKFRMVVDPVVLNGFGDLVQIGRTASGYQDRKIARAVAFERLITGLEILLSHYKLHHA